MTLAYDFDMHPYFEEEGEGPSGYVALFRDPDLVAALNDADDPVKQLFLESGFGLFASPDPIPTGYFDPDDTETREAVLANLAEGLRQQNGALRQMNWGGFVISDFLAALETAEELADEPEAEAAEVEEADMAVAAAEAPVARSPLDRVLPWARAAQKVAALLLIAVLVQQVAVHLI